jgi:hypothetical protein
VFKINVDASASRNNYYDVVRVVSRDATRLFYGASARTIKGISGHI